MADQFDAAAAVDGFLADQTAGQLKSSLALSVAEKPDFVAESRRLSQTLGLPPQTVAGDIEGAKQRATLETFDAAAYARDFPQAAKFMADPNNAAIAHDDTQNLGAVDLALSKIGSATRNAVAGVSFDISSGFYGLLETGTKLAAPLLDPLAGTILPENPLRRVAEGLEGWRKDQAATADLIAGPNTGGLVEQSVKSGFRSFGQMLPGMAATVISGNPEFALGSAGALQGSQSATKALDAGLSPLQATAYGAADATAEIATEMLPVGALLKNLKAGSGLFKTLGQQILTEVPTEMAATAWQNFNEWATLHPDQPFQKYLDELPAAEAQTVLATITTAALTAGMGKGIHAVVSRGQQQQAKAQDAEQTAQGLEALTQLAAASKLRERAPDTFAQFVEQATQNGPVPDVYIDANVLAQAGIAEQVSAVSPAVAEQLPAALASGGSVRIPVADFATNIAPTEYAQSMLDHLKTDPNGMSRADAQEYMQSHAEQLQQEVERALAEKQGDDTFKASAEAVKNEVKTQLEQAGRFTGNVNDAYASMVGNFYAVMGARLGISPQDMFARYPLQVATQRIEGFPQLDQAAQGPFGPVLTEYKGDAQAAIAKLIEMKGGEAIGALHHPNIGDIDLVWGEEGTNKHDGYGLAKLVKWHPEVLANLQDIISSMEVVKRSENRAMLESEDHKGGVRLQWDGQRKHWLLTAFRKDEGKSGDVPRTDTNIVTQEDDSLPAHPSDDIVDKKLDNFYQTSGVFNKGPESSARGAFNPATNTITLLKNADLSTFLHESGHFFLEVMADIASRENAPQQVRDDANALMKWFGLRDLDEWNNLDFEEKRSYHEKFARGFEAYLFEGNAPSIEMQGLFQRFRAWLLNIYKELKALNVDLNDEVRGVFDRMLASGEQIQLAEQGRSMMPLFTSSEQAGMTTDEFSAYQALGVDATNDAIQDLQARGLRDMQWIHNARGREIKRLQKEAKAKRAEVQMDVRKEVMSQPVYRAWQFLTAKEAGPDSPAGKLSRTALAEMYGGHNGEGFDRYAQLDWKRLSDQRMTADEGMHPDMVAEMFGYSSGDELVRALLSAEKPSDAVEAATDQRMLEQYGEVYTPEAIERAADEAIHNDARARVVATEANALAKATGKPKILANAAREFARAMIQRLKVRDVKPIQYAAAEARAAKAADKAMRSKDLEVAAAEKRNQLVNNYATRAAYDAQDRIADGLRYLKKFGRDGVRNGLDSAYVEQIDALLDKFDLRQQSGKQIDRTVSLRTWVQSRLNAGEIPDIAESLLTPQERAAYLAQVQSRDDSGELVYSDDEEAIKLLADAIDRSAKRSYKDMAVEEFDGLIDTVKSIEHLGRLKHKMLTAREQQSYEAVRDEIAAGIEADAKKGGKNTRTANDWLGKKLQAIKQFGAAHIKVATWAQIMDGGKDDGPVWRYLIRPANERATQETTMRAEATAALDAILRPVLAKVSMVDKVGKGKFFPTINDSLNWQERFAIALNLGNESNTQRLLSGRGWTMGQIKPILDTLTAEEWQAAQAVWDHFESYRPQIAEKERRVSGKEPEWISPRSISVQAADGKFLTLRGGYYPVVYDPRVNMQASQHSAAEEAKNLLKSAYSAATTRRSFTKQRVDEVIGRPLLLNLQGLYSGVNDVIHDLAWHEWVIDANKLLRSSSIDSSIREHYGPEVKKEFEKWRDDIVAGSRRLDHAIERAAGWARQGVSASALTFNAMSAVMQPLGLSNSIVRIGASWVGKGLARYVSGPIDATREARTKSEWMNNRARTRFRELNELRNQVQGQSAPKELMGRYGYWMMMQAQMMVDVPTWWGGYEKAIAEGHGEDTAIALADQAVKDSQGGGEEVDQSGVERGGPLIKLFTAFYGFMGTTLNTGVLDAKTEASKAKIAVNSLLLYSVPAVLGAILKDALTPGGGDEDSEKLIKRLIAEQLTFLMGMVAFGREFSQATKALLGEDHGMGYTGPAGLRVIPDTGNLAKQAAQGQFDDGFRKAFVNLLGDLAGIPAVQINRTITGAEAMTEGKTANPAALVFGFQKQ
ncbi:hypothetical protein [Cupriavidus metallidurans]|uniref:putative barnase/colicin E5 family endoribonuclease n=1 Tax=Cupriavidus metallidurans TaxID=119219 RepID=UPI001648FAEF|nr:hypothetical protein [Cupriavidus metallidurans]